jgi:hypothetical protein
MSVSKMRSIAAKFRSRRRAHAGARRVGQRGRPQGLPLCLPSVPAQAGIQEVARMSVSKMQSIAAQGNSCVNPAQAGIHG